MANILIVDDHRQVAELLTEELASSGYNVESIGDPDSVGEFITLFGPDLVVLDLYLKRRPRWDLLRDIKLRYPQLPVLIFTAYDGYLNDPRISQADAFMLKSIFLDRVRKHMESILNRKLALKPESEGVIMPCAWEERRSGKDRRKMERRKGERRSQEINFEFLIASRAGRRVGADRRQGERRTGERRRVECSAASPVAI